MQSESQFWPGPVQVKRARAPFRHTAKPHPIDMDVVMEGFERASLGKYTTPHHTEKQ
jgi:hypothetical protein